MMIPADLCVLFTKAVPEGEVWFVRPADETDEVCAEASAVQVVGVITDVSGF